MFWTLYLSISARTNSKVVWKESTGFAKSSFWISFFGFLRKWEIALMQD